jgi:GNAT superfamily N-acetyltransferase
MQIEYVSRIDGTKALPFIIDAYTSLRKSGHIDELSCPVTGREEAFYLCNRGKVVAVLSFYRDDDSFVVNMGFVLPRYRKQGLYRMLWERLVAEARKRKLRCILGYHAPENSDILGFNNSLGRKVKYICSEYVV